MEEWRLEMASRNTTRKKNFLLLHVDQQRYDCLGFTGSSHVKTPYLDSLANHGVQFTNAYSPCPLCCPERQTLLTSLMPFHHEGHWNFDNGSRIHGLDPDSFAHWPGILKEQGYRMGYVGKWHVNPVKTPLDFGYDYYSPEMPIDRHLLAVCHQDVHTKNPSTPAGLFGNGLYDTLSLDHTNTHRKAKDAIGFIRSSTTCKEPWHVRLDFSEPHLPCYPVKEFLDLYPRESIPQWNNYPDPFIDKPEIQKKQLSSWGIEHWTWKEWSSYLRCYFAMISQVDDAIGRVLTYLEDADLLDDTLIVYTSDHGDSAGSHGMLDKHYVMYEEVVHVPLVFSHPNTIIPAVAQGFVMPGLDLGPTILELLDCIVPQSFTGKSLVPVLQESTLRVRDHVFSEYNGQQFGLYTQRMVRDERYTYVWNPTSVDELYDHENDPDELWNVCKESANVEIVTRMRKILLEDFSNDPMVSNLWSRFQLLV